MVELKRPTTYQEQLEILQSRNLVIDDPAKSSEVLESISYYRFTAYLLPFKDANDCYLEGTNFHTIYRIYEFDRKLRGALLAA